MGQKTSKMKNLSYFLITKRHFFSKINQWYQKLYTSIYYLKKVGGSMETSFSELRAKVVINLTDGRRLGHIIDLIFEQNSARILGVVVPGSRSGVFKGREDIFIPYQCICKIGLDTILVELNPVSQPVNTANAIGKYSSSNSVIVEPETSKIHNYASYTGARGR